MICIGRAWQRTHSSSSDFFCDLCVLCGYSDLVCRNRISRDERLSPGLRLRSAASARRCGYDRNSVGAQCSPRSRMHAAISTSAVCRSMSGACSARACRCGRTGAQLIRGMHNACCTSRADLACRPLSSIADRCGCALRSRRLRVDISPDMACSPPTVSSCSRPNTTTKTFAASSQFATHGRSQS